MALHSFHVRSNHHIHRVSDWIDGGFLIDGGYPSHHSFVDGIFHEINHLFWGTVPHLWKTPYIIKRYWTHLCLDGAMTMNQLISSCPPSEQDGLNMGDFVWNIGLQWDYNGFNIKRCQQHGKWRIISRPFTRPCLTTGHIQWIGWRDISPESRIFNGTIGKVSGRFCLKPIRWNLIMSQACVLPTCCGTPKLNLDIWRWTRRCMSHFFH